MAKKRGEIDFIADTNGDGVMPIEVKSGNGYNTHAAIDALLANPEYQVDEGVVLSRSNVSRAGGVLNLPLYAVWCLSSVLDLAAEGARPATPFIMSWN